MTTVSLPEIPKGKFLEDYVAAFLQCSGFYVEKSLVDSGEIQVMELDIVAWKPYDEPPRHELFEVKGGDWGFSDVFKLLGWKTYLDPRGVHAAHLIAPTGSKTQRVVDFTREKCDEVGVNLISYNDLSALEANLKQLGLAPDATNELDHDMWRFSFWLERQMQKVVTVTRKNQKGHKGPDEVYSYQELIRTGLLQARDVRERLASLYDAHFNPGGWPGLSPPNLMKVTGTPITHPKELIGKKPCTNASINWFMPPCSTSIEQGWTF